MVVSYQLSVVRMLLLVVIILSPVHVFAAGNDGTKPPIELQWKFEEGPAGILGTFDRPSIQRGYQVYREVCAACHSMDLIAFRNLEEIGFSKAEVKAIAAEYEITDGPDDAGDMFDRPGIPADRFKAPFANEQAARASNGGAYPPDLSLMVKARPNGANYLYSLLTGYSDPPVGFELNDGQHYNPYFAGGQIAMAPPLSEGMVEYQDGTQASIDQMSRDVVNFLQWAAEPEMEHRKRLGIKVMIFITIFTILFYIAKKRVWARLDEK